MEENLHCLRKGTRLIGRYTIEGVLGQGGFGITYLGIDELHEKKVAIKEFFPQGIVTRNIEYQDTVTVTFVGEKDNYEKGKERFLKEARTMAKFSKDEGIVKALDFFEINNTAYIVMEYLEGITLKQYLRENKRIAPEDLIELLVPLIESLDEIHSQGMIHRDISPDNIMVLPDGRIKLMDFGAARDYTEFGEKSLSIVLKPGYAPPEQYQTHGIQGPWTDIYALCATMYKCITGENPPDAIERVMDDHLKKISAFGISVLPQIEEAIIKGMSVAAKDRYQNVGDFCEDLYGGYEENSEPEAEESQAEPVVAEANVETKMDMLTEETPQSKYPTTETVQEREKLISKELSENAGLTSEENVAKAGIETDKNDAGNKVPEQSPEKEKVSITPEKEGIPDNRGKEETKKIKKKNDYFPIIIGILILLGIAGTFAYNKSVSKKGTTAKVESSSQEEDKESEHKEETTAKVESSSQKKDKNPEYKVGETIEFGNYPQEEDGTEKPIEWIVMKNEGNQVLLLSKYVLDAKPYNKGWENVTWQTSDIRQWLNNEFYTTAFNKSEKAKIQTSLIKNEYNDTEDKVFLLSEKEAETLFSNDEERIAKATEYAEKSGVYVNEEKSGVYVNEEKSVLWWLRSPGDDSSLAAEVNDDGWVDRRGDDVDYDYDGVRPALYLKF